MKNINPTAVIIAVIIAITVIIALLINNKEVEVEPVSSTNESIATSSETVSDDVPEVPSSPDEPIDEVEQEETEEADDGDETEDTDETEPTPDEPLPEDNEGPVACTLDVKACSDGSYVGRAAPSCEFEACPPHIIDVAPVACTMDVKECSDGSFVSRVAPDCEFAACPFNPNLQLQMQ